MKDDVPYTYTSSVSVFFQNTKDSNSNDCLQTSEHSNNNFPENKQKAAETISVCSFTKDLIDHLLRRLMKTLSERKRFGFFRKRFSFCCVTCIKLHIYD